MLMESFIAGLSGCYTVGLYLSSHVCAQTSTGAYTIYEEHTQTDYGYIWYSNSSIGSGYDYIEYR